MNCYGKFLLHSFNKYVFVWIALQIALFFVVFVWRGSYSTWIVCTRHVKPFHLQPSCCSICVLFFFPGHCLWCIELKTDCQLKHPRRLAMVTHNIWSWIKTGGEYLGYSLYCEGLHCSEGGVTTGEIFPERTALCLSVNLLRVIGQ